MHLLSLEYNCENYHNIQSVVQFVGINWPNQLIYRYSKSKLFPLSLSRRNESNRMTKCVIPVRCIVHKHRCHSHPSHFRVHAFRITVNNCVVFCSYVTSLVGYYCKHTLVCAWFISLWPSADALKSNARCGLVASVSMEVCDACDVMWSSETRLPHHSTTNPTKLISPTHNPDRSHDRLRCAKSMSSSGRADLLRKSACLFSPCVQLVSIRLSTRRVLRQQHHSQNLTPIARKYLEFYGDRAKYMTLCVCKVNCDKIYRMFIYVSWNGLRRAVETLWSCDNSDNCC